VIESKKSRETLRWVFQMHGARVSTTKTRRVAGARAAKLFLDVVAASQQRLLRYRVKRVARASLLVVDGGSRLDVVMWSDAAYATGESDGDRMEGAERVVVIRRIVLGSVGRQEQAKKDTAQRSTKAATGGCCAQGR
jgi:hypothetical protein